MGFSMDLPDVEAVKEEVKVELAPKPETEESSKKLLTTTHNRFLQLI